MISLNIEKTLGFISKETVFAYDAQVKAAQEALENGTGKGNDFLQPEFMKAEGKAGPRSDEKPGLPRGGRYKKRKLRPASTDESQ